MMKVTIGKNKSGRHTLKCVSADELVRIIHDADYADVVTNLRCMYHLLAGEKKRTGKYKNIRPDAVSNIPSVCFTAEYRNSEGKQIMENMNPAFIIEINNLVGYEEVEYLRDLARALPYTYITFMGASGRSLKIICLARCSKPSDELTAEEMEKLLIQAYSDASKYYSAQLGTSVDIKIPTLQSACKVSADPQIYFNPAAEEFFVNDMERKAPVHQRRILTKDDTRLLPGYDLSLTQRFQFEDYLCQVIEANLGKPQDEAADNALQMLARYCHDDDLPKEMCIYRTLRHPDLGIDENYVRKIFDNAYKKDLVRFHPLSHVTPEILLTRKTQAFMTDRYELRRNILKGVVEYRVRDGRNLPFKDLTNFAINSMTQDALNEGLKSWDKDMRRYIDSDKIAVYDPIENYLENLPVWDEEDHIEAFANLIPTDNPDWKKNFHVWMLSMVAHWMGKDMMHGNAYTPLLIGQQGCGKSSFCHKILPPQLDSYYYDHIDFKNEQSADLALTRFALINIDEFDQLTARRQAILKYLLQKSSVKTRRPYGIAIEELRRYASFIGTTNNTAPLSDTSGSRRFICVLVQGMIDHHADVNHDQMYAQAVSEICAGARYWFDDAETAVIMRQNETFQIEDGLAMMVKSYFVPAKSEKSGEWIFNNDILCTLRKHFKNLKDDVGTLQRLGKTMKDLKFKLHRTTAGRTQYFVEKATKE